MAPSLFDLKGRIALVTGSSQGIGLALAHGLSKAGAQIILNGRDAGKLADAARTIEGARARAFDVTDHEATRAAVDRIEAEIGPIDILVNNAGMQHRAPLAEFPADAFDRLTGACTRITRATAADGNPPNVYDRLAREGFWAQAN